MRSRFAGLLVAALLTAGACTGAATAPTTLAPSASPTPLSAPTAAPTPTATSNPTPVPLGRWEAAGSLVLGRSAPLAVGLETGGALVVGNDVCGSGSSGAGPFSCDKRCIRDDSRQVETWDPAAGWEPAEAFGAARADFAAVPLADGRVLVTGGVGPLSTDDPERPWRHHASFAGTHLFDAAAGTWSQAAPLATARTAPIASVLRDGRVLVAGGYDLNAETGPWTFGPGGSIDGEAGIVLAAHHAAPVVTPGPPSSIFANMTPQGADVLAVASAELYDPATDTWTSTGPLRYARFAQAAVTLADGRVLVVPGTVRPQPLIGGWVWGGRVIRYPEPATAVAEIYDPETGRFALAGALPAIDWSALAPFGYDVDWDYEASPGTLVALADGGALLVGQVTGWNRADASAPDAGAEGQYVRTLRFDPVAKAWTEIDSGIWVDRHTVDQDTTLEVLVPGYARAGSVAARLGDGRVLVAGGLESTGVPGTLDRSTDAVLYDPATGAWTSLPPMPEPRAGGAAVTLADGSVMLVGGLADEGGSGEECGSGTTGSASTVRFVPEP